MIAEILTGLARANLASAAAIVLVLVLRKPARRLFGAQAAYALWAMPLLAAGAALAPHPAASPIAAPMATLAPIVLSAADGAERAIPAAVSASPSILPALLAAWAFGALVAVALLWRRQAGFMASLGRLQPSDDGTLRAQHAGVGPAVVGALRPRIVTPADFEARFDAGERQVILAHERVHLAAGDARINALAAAVQCACWFNPLVHLAARRLRIDQELACDAAVLGRFPAARRLYAEVLLKTQLATQPLPLGCHWPAHAAHPLKERIVMLKSPLPAASRRALGLAAVAAVTLTGAAAAWAAQPAGLEPAEAAKRVGPGQTLDCKPDANRELHNCRIMGTPFAKVATAADVQREWPAQARKAGETGWVVLQCTPSLAHGRLEACSGYHYGGAADASPQMRAAFEKAAVRVASVIRLKTRPGPNDFKFRDQPGFFTIEFNDHPDLPGAPVGPPPTRFPDFLPGPHGKPAAPAKVSQAAPPARKVLAAFAAPPTPATGPKASPAPSGQAAPTPAAGLAAFEQSPNWSRRPTVEDLVKVYPPEAVKAKVEGDVVLHCHVTATGALADCSVLRETPEGAGFGAAALKLTDLFEAREQTPEGGPKRGTDIRISIRFRMPAPSAT